MHSVEKTIFPLFERRAKEEAAGIQDKAVANVTAHNSAVICSSRASQGLIEFGEEGRVFLGIRKILSFGEGWGMFLTPSAPAVSAGEQRQL